jgi:hypothetical protein
MNRTADDLGVRGLIVRQQKPQARGGERHREDRGQDDVFHCYLPYELRAFRPLTVAGENPGRDRKSLLNYETRPLLSNAYVGIQKSP